MSNHFDLIHEYCEVIAEVDFPVHGIYYKENDCGVAEFETEEGFESYSCHNMTEFQNLCESYEEEPVEDFDDLECGFDPYEGCYTYDC